MKNLKVEATVRNEAPTEAPTEAEQVRILKEVGTIKAALISVGKPGQESAAAMQCLAEFGICHDLQMTPQIVLNAMIESRRNELQCKAIKQDLQ